MPTYAQLKGKVWLMQGGDGVDLGGELQIATDDSGKVVSTRMWVNQDLWNGPINAKKNAALEIITNSKYQNLLKINFLSQSYDLPTGNTPQEYSEMYNPWFLKEISDKNLTNIGIVISDFTN
jgi:hypothetical protein